MPMTTPTITEYAVQIEMDSDTWLFVMDKSGDEILTYPTRGEAVDAMKIWHDDHSRVVSRVVSPYETDWRE